MSKAKQRGWSWVWDSFKSDEVGMSKARQRERKERRQKHGAHGGISPAVPGEGTGRDVGGLPSHIEIPRHTIQALVAGCRTTAVHEAVLGSGLGSGRRVS